MGWAIRANLPLRSPAADYPARVRNDVAIATG